MRLEIREITRRRELVKFIHLPARIHNGHRKWVPPIYAEERRFFNPEKNLAFSYCDTTLALAYLGGHPAGRIMGIINRRYNELRGERTARFGYLECFQNEEVAHALLDYVEKWARDRGMVKLVGPMGFTDQDPEGFLVEGFEYEPTVATYYNFKYLLPLLASKGYEKEIDYVVYKVDVFSEIPKFYERICDRVLTRGKYALVEFGKRREFKPYILPVLGLMNETFKDFYGYTPLDEAGMVSLAKKYFRVVDPRFVKIITENRSVIAFIVGVPNMSEGIRKSRGRLFPFGLIHILHAAKKTKQLDLLIGAIKQGYRGKGLDAVLGAAMIRSARRAGFAYVDSHHELETNFRVRSEMERLGGELYKRYRIFRKQLLNAFLAETLNRGKCTGGPTDARFWAWRFL